MAAEANPFVALYKGKLSAFDWKHPPTPKEPDFWTRFDQLVALRSMQRMFDPDAVVWNKSTPTNWHMLPLADVGAKR